MARAAASKADSLTEPVRAEHRWPAAVALLVALVLYALLPSSFFPAFRYVVVGLGIVLMMPRRAVVLLRFPACGGTAAAWARPCWTSCLVWPAAAEHGCGAA